MYTPETYDLHDLYDLFPLQFMMKIFQGRHIPDLYGIIQLMLPGEERHII